MAGRVDPDELLPDAIEYLSEDYFNLFCNLDTGEHRAIPVCRKGNAQYALRQSFKKSDLAKIIRNSKFSFVTEDGTYSQLHFMTLTFDHNLMTRDEANYFITTKGKGIKNFFGRFEKVIDKGFSKVLVKESTINGYPAVHIILYLEKPLKVKFHRKSNTYRPDPSDPYTKRFLGKLKNLDNWNSASPLWKVGFLDFYSFTMDDMKMKGYSNPVNYIAKYISKSLDLTHVKEFKTCKRVSELPVEYRTAVWTILNTLIWGSHTWVISNKFKEDLKKIKEKREARKSSWMYVDTVSISDPRLYTWMGYDVSKLDISSIDPVTLLSSPP